MQVSTSTNIEFLKDLPSVIKTALIDYVDLETKPYMDRIREYYPHARFVTRKKIPEENKMLVFFIETAENYHSELSGKDINKYLED